MLIPKKLEANTFLSSLMTHKIKIHNFESKSKFIDDFVNKYKTTTIEANSDIRSFLEHFGFTNYNIADGKTFEKTNGRFDLAISKDINKRYKVLIEIKKPNSDNMIEFKNGKFNFFKKAFYQSVYYYLSDRNDSLFTKNQKSQVKFLIITDYINWYIIKTADIDNIFNTFGNKPQVNYNNTEVAYKELEKYFEEIVFQNGLLVEDIELPFAYFNLLKIGELEKKFFLKIISPDFLLDVVESTDRNSVTKKFYNELFYILGLKQNSKKQLSKTDENFTFLALIYEQLSAQYNENEKFELSVELIITWISRILFIHLYSSILVKYKVINTPIFANEKNLSFDDINDLFFEILNKKERDIQFKKELHFDKILYINSSLFQKSPIEESEKIYISSLKSNRVIKLYEKTNIKDSKDDDMNILEYLVRFLNSYNIAADEHFTDNSDDDLINASILGIVFEKLNGYKDGSYYTPSYITEYMAKTTVEKAIISKFNQSGFIGNTVDEIGGNINKNRVDEALTLFNTITILDPAVGSGHFLVSSLNTMLLYKAKLGLFENAKLNQISILDDTIIVDNLENYDKTRIDTKTHDIYKELYLSKENIIGNSLFGVDINPKSVQIARLRLWIELLKHTYFTLSSELSLLPNIDINVKQGNSLLSDFKLDYQFDTLFEQKYFLEYKKLISEYKNPKNNRTELLSKINQIKNNLDENYTNKNKFEWRYEFPEVLDDNGKFVGFDVVIGNPPYIALSKIKNVDYSKFEVYEKTGDILAIFIEKSIQLCKIDTLISFIVSNSWLKTKYGESLKKFLNENGEVNVVNFIGTQIFEDATVESCILTHIKRMIVLNNKNQPLTIKTIRNFDSKTATIKTLHTALEVSVKDDKESLLIEKVEYTGTILKEWDIKIYRGILTGFNEAFIIDSAKKDELIAKDPKSAEIIKPILRGRDIQKYTYEFANKWMVVTKYESNCHLQEKYPEIYNHLLQYEGQLKNRGQCKYSRGSSGQGQHHWLELDNNPKDTFLEEFGKPKIIWGEISDNPKFSYENGSFYTEATSFIMTGESLKYLLAFLNSKLSKWYFEKISTTTGMGTSRWKKFKLELLPIPKIDEEKQQPFIKLVDEILEIRKYNPKANTKKLEEQIDKIVYELYELSKEEIDIIRDSITAKEKPNKIKPPKQRKLEL